MFVLDSAADALRLRTHLENLRARAASGHDAPFSVAVVGAGFTGLEVATELAGWIRDLARAVGALQSASVTLIDRGPYPGASLGPSLRPAIEQALQELGIRVVTGVHNVAIEPDGVRVNGALRVAASTIVWCAGLRSSSLTAQFDAARDGAGRLEVDARLAVPGHRNLFAAGDVARAPVYDGMTTQMSCQHAIPMGRVAGHNAVSALLGAELRALEIARYVTCLDLGDAGALFSMGWQRELVWSGEPAKSLKRLINRQLIVPPDASDLPQALALAAPSASGTLGEAPSRAFWRGLLPAEAS